MSLWALVPVKPFAEGKSRLAGYVSPPARQQLNRRLLRQTLETIQQADVAGGVLVVSRDAEALALAARAGAHPLREEPETATEAVPGDPESRLNSALAQAAAHAIAQGATAILVLPTDIPELTVQDVQRVAALEGAGPQVVIAPSGDGGTNALLLQPAWAIPFAFGPGSFQRHQQLAQAAGLPVRVVESATLAFDVDWPEDYARASVPQAER